jgi:L-2,4-diaminobutyric acid acetyltransferase
MVFAQSATCHIRKAKAEDGQHIWKMSADSGKLDVNSAYCYIMLCEYFSDTCLIAEWQGERAGFVTAFVLPANPEVLFVWQIAVSAEHRGKGIAAQLLQRLIASKSCEEVRFIEATVSPGNKASRRLLAKFAEHMGAPTVVTEGFAAQLFPGALHEDEPLIRIGPIKRPVTAYENKGRQS